MIVDGDGMLLLLGEEGEIVVCGGFVMSGYLNVEEEMCKMFVDGWLCMGDVGVFDECGFLFLCDCICDVIIIGGFNVYLGDVEVVLLGYLVVVDCLVVGILDDKWGEVVYVVV